MADNPDTGAAQDVSQRLQKAEAAGLRLALLGRSTALIPVAIWFISLGSERTGILVGLGLLAFAALGFGFRAIVGTPRERPLYKYVFFTIDIAAIGAIFAFAPLSQGGDVPQILVYRGIGIYYFFIVLGVAALTLSPRLLLWCGIAIVGTWWAVFAHITSGMARTLSWGDLPLASSAEEYAALVLDPDFIAQGSRFEETITLMIAALLLAFAVHRARMMVRDWAKADLDRSRIADMFGQFVPASIVERLMGNRAALAPARQDATVLFLDIAGFTSLSEERSPEEVIAILNEVFDAAGECIGRRGGVVTNLQGDGLLAVFNVPGRLDDHAQAALEAAIDIAENVSDRRFRNVEISVRVGLHTGPVAAGIVGSGHRQVYTVYGDTVNVASRLEQANKDHSTVVMASAATISSAAQAPAEFQQIGDVEIRGLTAPIGVYGMARQS